MKEELIIPRASLDISSGGQVQKSRIIIDKEGNFQAQGMGCLRLSN